MDEVEIMEVEGLFFQSGFFLKSIKWTVLQTILEGIARLHGYSEPDVYFIRKVMKGREIK